MKQRTKAKDEKVDSPLSVSGSQPHSSNWTWEQTLLTRAHFLALKAVFVKCEEKHQMHLIRPSTVLWASGNVCTDDWQVELVSY